MSDERGFTVTDRRRVKPDEANGGGGKDDGGESRDPAGGENQAREKRSQSLPPVDFSGFIFGLGQMALTHLGEFPELTSGEHARDLEQARHTIDILDMLRVKTEGNLSDDESRLLRSLLGELKLKYVRLSNEQKG